MAVTVDGSPAVRELGFRGPVHAVHPAGLQLQAGEALGAASRGQLSPDRRVDQSEHVSLVQEVVSRPLSQCPHQFRSIGQVSHSFYGAQMDDIGSKTLGYSELGKGSHEGGSSRVYGLAEGPKEARHRRKHDEEFEVPLRQDFMEVPRSSDFRPDNSHVVFMR